MFRIKFCREITLKLLYQIDVLKLEATEVEKTAEINSIFLKGLREEEIDFIMKIINQVVTDRQAIDESISNNLIGWKLERLTPIDRNLLRMGIAESHFNSQRAIIIDDHIRIAKKFSEKDSYKIINAILDKIIK